MLILFNCANVKWCSDKHIFTSTGTIPDTCTVWNSLYILAWTLNLQHTHKHTQSMAIREAITLGQTAVQSPLAPAEICSAPHPIVSPNISNRHRPAAPCPHHQSALAPAPLINDDLCRRDRGLRDRGYRAGKGDRCWRSDHPCDVVMPQCHTMAGLGLQFKRLRRNRVSSSREGRVGGHGGGAMTFKFRGAVAQGRTWHQLEMSCCQMSAGRLSITWSAPGRTSSN